MLTTKEYLTLINERGRQRKPLKRVFSNILKRPELFVNAVAKIAPNKGAGTPGVDGQTIDGTSLTRVNELIGELRNKTFRWTPVRREYIPKGKGATRPIGIPSWRDKVVQEVLRVVLEAYYEPQFHSNSHGFRPERGCHTALREISNWTGTKWFIEGDIKGCFDNIDHEILLDLMANKVQDNQIIALIRGLLKAGYVEDWTYHKTYSGTPQGGILSPLLANVYLDVFDWKLRQLQKRYTSGDRRAMNPERSRAYRRAHRPKATEQDKANWREMRKQPSVDVQDANFRRFNFIRYADDWLIGFIGPKSETTAIKAEIGAWLKRRLKLELSPEKTLITNANEPATFLGYEVSTPVSRNWKVTGKPILRVPHRVKSEWRAKYTKKGKVVARNERIILTDAEIMDQFNAELRGILQYYKYAVNLGSALGIVAWTVEISMLHTLARKHQTSVKKIVTKYKELSGNYRFIIRNKEGKIIGRFDRPALSYTRIKDKLEPIRDILPWTYYGTRELAARLTHNTCEIPGCESLGAEVHHIKALKELRTKYKKDKRPLWARIMIERRRKNLLVCQKHHKAITYGRYDGPNLKNIETE